MGTASLYCEEIPGRTEEARVAYKIIETCIGCTACTKRCPTEAITGSRNQIHQIDPDLCIDCGSCSLNSRPEPIPAAPAGARPTFPRTASRKPIPRQYRCTGSGCAP